MLNEAQTPVKPDSAEPKAPEEDWSCASEVLLKPLEAAHGFHESQNGLWRS